MARTPSTMLKLGTQAPEFSLLEPASGSQVSLNNFKDSPVLIVFSCNHCPYVLHIIDSFVSMANSYLDKGLSTVWINANDVEHYPDDSPEKMVQLVRDHGFKFPYVYDQTQQVAQAFQAACTPDFFLFDSAHRLVYRGQYDASRPGNNEPVTGHDLKLAIDALLAGNPVTEDQLPSLGCNVKWKAGNEPDYV